MSAPVPKKSLSGHCSVIDNNTLYVLTSNAFQSLPLKENATWSSLPTGESVTGSACVRAVPNGDEANAALYVIGGTSGDDSFGGMQRFFFSNQSWETLTPLTTDMKGRTDHSITYLNDSSSILVYAGSQPQSQTDLSSQTFLISVNEPYDISSFTSQAPPANQPILLPWDSSSAVMLGGQENNKRIFTFDPTNGWEPLDTNLTSPLTTGAKAALISGGDGSKVLEVYDATTSPNGVQQLVLLGAGGSTASNGQTISSPSSTSDKSSSSRKRKRDLTLSNWPDYNSTNAPTAKRSEYSVAQSSNGLAVISGGNDDEPLNIFNQQKNAWVDNEVFFGGSNQVPLTTATPSATSTPSVTSTTSATATTTSAEPEGVKKATSNNTRRTLGITLGVLSAVAVLFAAALIYMRWRKNRRKQEQNYVDEKNADRMSFADRGASFMKEAGSSIAELNSMKPPPAPFHGHNDSQSSIAMFGGAKLANGGHGQPRMQDTRAPATEMATLAPPNFHDGNNNNHSSLAIIAGKFGANRHSRNIGSKGSFESTTRLVRSPSTEPTNGPAMELDEISNKTPTHAINRKPVAQGDHLAPAVIVTDQRSSAEPSPLHVKKRSSGWSKYFAPNDESGYFPAHANSSNLSVSQYTQSRVPSMPLSVNSALVPPLDINNFRDDLEAQRFSAVAKGRPSFNHSSEDLAARGASLDSVRPHQAAFHTGHSLDAESFLNFNRESFNSRRHSTDSMSSRITSSIFFSGADGLSGHTAFTPTSQEAHAKPIDTSAPGSPAIREIHIAPNSSPRIGHLQRAESGAFFARPASSTYSASIAPGRDSRMPITVEDYPGRALSPPVQGPPSIQIPGPAARAAAKGTNNSGFFPGNKDSFRPPPRKLGGLHPGTLAAISGSGVSVSELEYGKIKRLNPDGDNRDSNVSNVTVWPDGNDAPSDRFQKERERLMREKAEAEMAKSNGLSVNYERERLERQAREMKEKEIREGTGTGESGFSEYSWLNLGAQR